MSDPTMSRQTGAMAEQVDADLAHAASFAAAERAAARITFQLTYARAAVQRKFSEGFMTGPSVPCAYGNEQDASGDWEAPHDGPDLTEDQWIDEFASYAINEAIHEALEWLRVDGRPWLNPHGPCQMEIYDLTNDLCVKLAELRREVRKDADGHEHNDEREAA
jgi:hypothetical protein